MHKMWVRIITTVCIVALLIANPGMTVLADVMPGEAGAASEETELTQGDVAESAEGTDSAAMSSEETDAVAEPAEDTDSAAVSPEDADPSMDSGNQVKSEENDDSNSGVTESEVTETDIEEDLVGSIFPGGFEVDPGDTNWLNAIADGVQAQSGVKAATVTREFLTGTYRLGSLPQFNSTTVDGVNLQSSQCCGYANMFFYKLTGHTTYNNTYKVAQEYLNSAGRLKEVLAASKAGAHIRIESLPHSMVFLLSEDGGFYMLHWNNGVGQCSYTTYEGFVSKYKDREFYVQMPNDYPNDIPQPVPTGSEMTSGYDAVLPDGDYAIVSALNPAHYLDIYGADYPALPDTNVMIAGPDSGHLPVFEVWTISYSGGFYTITQKGTNIAMEVGNADTRDGANVRTWGSNGTIAQHWAISQFGDGLGYRLQARCSGYSLDITGAAITTGTNVQQHIGNDSDAQRWLFIPYDPEKTIEDGRYVLVSALRPDLVMDMPGETADVPNGANVAIHTDRASSCYNSVDVTYLGNGYYSLIHAASGKSLDIYGRSRISGTNVELWPYIDENHQKWAIIPQGEGYRIVNRHSGLVLDVEGGGTTDGTNIRQFFYDGSLATTWKFAQAEHTVTYDANGGSGAPGSQTKHYANPMTIADTIPVLDGKIFKGWSEDSSAASAEYQPGGTFVKDIDATLYAVWEEDPALVKPLTIVSISDDFYGKTGTQASFRIEAEGSGTISYQWQYRTVGATSWKTPAQASAKTADYVFNLKPSYDNIEVRCIVSDESGTEKISETRKANVFAFKSQPSDETAEEGKVVTFEVSAIGRGVTYQWYYMRPEGAWRKTTVEGSNTAVLPITAGTINDGTSYRCVITDEAGNKITSAAGILTLDNSLRITGISEDAYDVNGESVTFHIDAVGTGDLSYQWQYKLAGSSKWKTPAQASAKTANYVFKLRPSYENIEVRCIVKDASGNSVTSDVRKANVFAIISQPQDAELEMGEQTTFAVEAVGKELIYQWYYMRPESSWKKVTVAGYNTASLVITANNKNDGTKFQCRITDGLGNMLISSAALLTQS